MSARPHFLIRWLAACALLVSGAAFANSIPVWVDFEQAGALGIARLIESRANPAEIKIEVQDSNEIADGQSPLSQQLQVTVGRQALETWLSHSASGNVLALLVTRYDWQQLLKSHPSLRQRGTALHVDPSPLTQLRLAQSIRPSPQRVGILVHEDIDLASIGLDQVQADPLVSVIQTNESENTLQEISQLLERSDALIAIPDSRLYGPQNFRHVLLSAYRQRKPVIGFSGAGVRAGCIAAPYVNGEDLADAALRRIRELASWPIGTPLPAPQDIPSSEIRVNQDVANALGIQVEALTEDVP